METNDQFSRMTNSGSGSGEGQFLMHDVVLAQRNDEEYTEEAGAGGKSNKFTDVVRWIGRHETETVHGGDGADKQDTQSS